MTEENKSEVKAGSQPDDKPKDEKVDSSPTQDGKEKSSDSEQPWHKDPRFKDDLKLLKSAKSLMEANGLEDVDDLKDLVESGKKIKGKPIDVDRIDEILENSNELAKMKKFWAQQDELRKRGIETPEQTIARLTAEREHIRESVVQKEQREREVYEAKQSIQNYEHEVKSQLSSVEDLPPDVREVIAWSLGVGNECNEIQLNDRKAIRKLVNDGVKKYNNMVKTIEERAIKEYLAGKKSIPDVQPTAGAVATSKTEPPKGLKGMRNALAEYMLKGGKP